MASAKELKDRIKAVQETKKITGAMYLISSTKLRRAKADLAQTRPYFDSLRDEIGQILGVSAHRRTILIGLGNLGRAIATHVSFPECGCELIGLFDSNPFVAGRDLDGMPIHHTDTLSGFCHQERPELAVLCVPENAAPKIAKKLVELGVRAFWNFSHGDLHFEDPAILVENVHLADSLLTLTYGLGHDSPHETAAGTADS